jgi:hypothetical protein
LAKIQRLIEPGERIVYRARFGPARVTYELAVTAAALTVGVLTGPGILLAILFLAVWLYAERSLREVVVTNQRVIQKKGWIRPQIDEINLRQVESIKNNGQRVVIIGSGGSKMKLPYFLADETGLGRAVRSAHLAPTPEDATSAGYVAAAQTTDADPFAGRPFWKRPVFIALAIVFGPALLIGPFVDVSEDAAVSANETANSNQTPDGAVSEDSAKVASAAPASVSLKGLPDEVLQVVETDVLRYARRSLTVQLSKEIDETTQVEIARYLQAQEPRFRNTYVDYYLPGMVEGAGAWAVAHIEAGVVKAQTLGLTSTEIQKLASEDARDEIVGRWRDDRPGVGSVMTIRKEQGGFVLSRKFSDGDSMTQRLKERPGANDRRFDIHPADTDFGEYLILKQSGVLEFHDDEGLVFVARQIN